MGTWTVTGLARPALFGGARRDRTADLLHAMQALSQLSYSPEIKSRNLRQARLAVKNITLARRGKRASYGEKTLSAQFTGIVAQLSPRNRAVSPYG